MNTTNLKSANETLKLMSNPAKEMMLTIAKKYGLSVLRGAQVYATRGRSLTLRNPEFKNHVKTLYRLSII